MENVGFHDAPAVAGVAKLLIARQMIPVATRPRFKAYALCLVMRVVE